MFAANTSERALVDSMGIKKFVRLDDLRSLSLSRVTVMYLTRETIKSFDLTSSPLAELELPFGSVSMLRCGGINVGYLLQMPKCHVDTRNNYATFSIKADPSPSDFNRFFVDKEFAVVGNADALLAVNNNYPLTKEAAK